MSEHSKLPWKVYKCENSHNKPSVDIIFEEDSGFVHICDCGDWDNESAQIDAAFIVRACNHFDELREALKLLSIEMARVRIGSGYEESPGQKLAGLALQHADEE